MQSKGKMDLLVQDFGEENELVFVKEKCCTYNISSFSKDIRVKVCNVTMFCDLQCGISLQNNHTLPHNELE